METALVVDDAEHHCSDDSHQDRAGNGRRPVYGARPTQWNGHDQTNPQQHVENHGRTDTGGSQRKAGIGLGDSRTRHQSEPQRIAGGASPGQDAAERPGAQLDPKQIESRQSIGVGSESSVGNQRVAVKGHEFEPDGNREEDRIDPGEVADGISKRRHQRKNEKVDDDGKKHPTKCLQHYSSVNEPVACATA